MEFKGQGKTKQRRKEQPFKLCVDNQLNQTKAQAQRWRRSFWILFVLHGAALTCVPE